MEQQCKIILMPPSYSFSWLNLCTVAIFYAKIEVDLYIKWWIVFLPTIIFFIYKLLSCLAQLGSMQEFAGKINSSDLKLHTLWKFTLIIILSTLIAFTIFLAEFLERLDSGDKSAYESFKHIAAALGFIFVVFCGYTWSVRKILGSELLPLTEGADNHPQSNQFAGQLLNSILSVMGNTMSICAGGTCNSLYISTLSAFFSAFGIPIFEYLHYLNFIALFCIAISLLSLYSVKKSICYAPFILSIVGALLIMIDMMVIDLDQLTYLGNAFMIGSAIWNSRLNKHRFGRKK